MPKKERPKEQCSFCGKDRDRVKKLIAGGTKNIYICDECVELCCDILAAEGFDEFRLEKDEGSKQMNNERVRVHPSPR